VQNRCKDLAPPDKRIVKFKQITDIASSGITATENAGAGGQQHNDQKTVQAEKQAKKRGQMRPL
jgi:hypothetical protein